MRWTIEPIVGMARWAGGFVLVTLLLLSCAKREEPVVEKTPAPPSEEAEMALIPRGEFLMGKEGHQDFSPQHKVWIDPFYIDKYEVTNAQYFEFCEATDHKLPEFWGLDVYRSGLDHPDHPVVGVSWLDATAYATWRGARLPTEAEWEYAARGGLITRNYSHGDEMDSTLYAPSGFTGDGAPSPVGSFPPNGHGLYDMTRNVAEWVSDWYDYDYYAVSPQRNPTGPGHGKFRGLRGGGWHTGPYCSRVYIRTGLQSNWVDFNVGFRCAKYYGESAALRMERIIEESEIAAAVEAYREMRKSDAGTYYHDETEFNDMGYRLLADGKHAEAIEVFKLNTEAFPKSFNAFDSLGEAYMTQGNRNLAVVYYHRSLELNPANSGGRRKLAELEGE